MAKKNNTVNMLNEARWSLLKSALDKINETLWSIEAKLSRGNNAPASEPVQLTIDEVTEEKYYTPDELATLGIRAHNADKFDIFDGDDIVLKDVSYRSYENGTKRSIWDMLGVAQSTFSHNYISGKPFKMPDYNIRYGVVKMHRRRG